MLRYAYAIFDEKILKQTLMIPNSIPQKFERL